jgi:multidrug resistance efflux pump
MNKKKIILGAGLAGLFLIVCALALIGTGGIAAAKSTATGTLLPPVKDSGGVIADGRVVPQTGAELAFAAGGVVAEVRVEEGRMVAAGDVLARLEGYERAELEIAAAKQEQLAAGQALEEVKRTGPVLAAQAALDEQTARENKEVAENNGWDESTYELTRTKYALLVARWESALEKLNQYPNGVAVEEIKLAEARVASAEKRRMAAEAGLTAMELCSPVSGTIVYLDLQPGRVASPGAVVAAVADLSVWQVKTVDLNETDIPKVSIGDRAILTFDAIPGLEITGQVVAVSAYGQNRLGETVYTVTVRIEKTDPRLRWNMTAMVKIQPD